MLKVDGVVNYAFSFIELYVETDTITQLTLAPFVIDRNQ